MSETLEVIKRRRSCRKFQNRPVPEELVDQVIEAGTWAANGRGLQSPVIVYVTNQYVKRKLTEMNAKIWGREDTDPFFGAPVILLVLADKNVPTYVYDGSLALGNMMLAADDLGLASCWIHRAKEEFESEEGKTLLKAIGIDNMNLEGIGHLALGYRDGEIPEPKERKKDYVYYAEE